MIGIAKESGVIAQLGTFILERSCADFSSVMARYEGLQEHLCLSINISVKQHVEQDFKKQFLKSIDRYQLERNQLTIEITKSIFIEELEYILPLLNETRETGVNISLDNFGTSYSSLNMLCSLLIDELKIDKPFVNNICHVEQEAKMTVSTIDMGSYFADEGSC